jgi:hypothetical protein
VVLGPTRSLAFTSTRDGVLATTTARGGKLSQITRSSTRLVSAAYGLFTAMQMRCGGMGTREQARGLVQGGRGANVAKEDENSDWQQRQRSDVPVAKELDAPEAG